MHLDGLWIMNYVEMMFHMILVWQDHIGYLESNYIAFNML